MKTIQIPVRLPEKQDIIESWNSLTNEEICRFVCEFEGISNAQKIAVLPQFHKVREDENFTEFISETTLTVYQVSMYDETLWYDGIYFAEKRPKDIGYVLIKATKEYKAYCRKCNTTIYCSITWLGKKYNYCNCKQ